MLPGAVWRILVEIKTIQSLDSGSPLNPRAFIHEYKPVYIIQIGWVDASIQCDTALSFCEMSLGGCWLVFTKFLHIIVILEYKHVKKLIALKIWQRMRKKVFSQSRSFKQQTSFLIPHGLSWPWDESGLAKAHLPCSFSSAHWLCDPGKGSWRHWDCFPPCKNWDRLFLRVQTSQSRVVNVLVTWTKWLKGRRLILAHAFRGRSPLGHSCPFLNFKNSN